MAVVSLAQTLHFRLKIQTYLTNMVELIASGTLTRLPCIFALGFYIKRKKFAYVIFGVMTWASSCLFVSTICILKRMGILKLPGWELHKPRAPWKERKCGLVPHITAYWSIVTTITSNGSVNGMHDSLMPLIGWCCN